MAPHERGKMNELALFAGAGGGILGGKLLGWRTRCAVEIDPYCRSVLLARQRDGILDPFPIWDDVQTFSGFRWKGNADVITGGFPCQDVSAAGKGKGLAGERSGLWSHMARIIGEVQPRYVLVENSPLLTSRGLDVVLADLAAMGFDAEWGVVGAHHAGAPHRRDRIWILANAKCVRRGEPTIGTYKKERPLGSTERCQGSPRIGSGGENVSHHDVQRLEKRQGKPGDDGPQQSTSVGSRCEWWDEDPADVAYSEKLHGDGSTGQRERKVSESGNGSSQTRRSGNSKPRLGRVADGVAHRVDRLKAIGNGQVPCVVELAWEILSGNRGATSWNKLNKVVDMLQGRCNMKVVRVTKTEFEMENGKVYPIDPPLTREMSVDEFQRHRDATAEIVRRVKDSMRHHGGDKEVGQTGENQGD